MAVGRGTKIGAALLALAAAGWMGHKAWLFAAPPEGDKNCTPLAPADTDGSSEPVASNEAGLRWVQRGGTINDVSCLNRTAVYGIVDIRSAEEAAAALAYAKVNKLKVSIAAAKHSMGGQAFCKGCLVLDMRRFDFIRLNETERTVTVGPGATWHDIQSAIHPRFAVKSMQSSDVFSVGGSISVNAHGMDHIAGSVARSIRSMRVLLPDGTFETVSRELNPDLFWLVVGGYGLFGVIVEATVDVVSNDIYETGRRVVSYDEFGTLFDSELKSDPALGLMYGHLSTAPASLLREMIVYTYRKGGTGVGTPPPLGDVTGIWMRRLALNLSKRADLFKELKWYLEKSVEPRLEHCTIPRGTAMGLGEACLVSRNDPMHDSVGYLFNRIPEDTDILHEYFVPRGALTTFIDGLRSIFESHDANLLNASVRVVHKEDNILSYAPEEAFSVVLYLNQATDADGNARMKALTSDLIDLAHAQGGRFFLPYQLHYTAEQLRRSYPQIGEFFALKRQRDPAGLFSNRWYETYAPQIEA